MKKILCCVVMAGVLCVAAGCVSTPADRIKKEPRLFASFPAEIQAKVQKGEVDIGFTKDMVRLALGLPQRINSRTTEAGQTEIWIYTGIRYINRIEPFDTGYWYRDRAGRLHQSHETAWVDGHYSQEFPLMRVEFTPDKVKAIEQVRR